MAYNLSLINEYLNGGELEGYDVNKLENDPKFMRDAILASGDKKLYQLCSRKVKSNYEFVDFLITRFKYDYEFIDQVATYFMEHPEDKVYVTDIIVKMCNILKNTREYDMFAKYRIQFMAKFFVGTIEINAYKEVHPNDRRFGLGFIVFQDEFGHNIETLKYFAVQMIDNLFEEVIDLEEIIHKEFRTPNDIYNGGLVNFMINFLNRYDTQLADFAAVHPEILNDFQERLNKIQVKWNRYVDKEEAFRYEEMFDKVHKYYESVEMRSDITEEDYLYYIGKELGIADKIASYQGMDRETYEMLYGDVDEKIIKQALSNLQERFIYTTIKKIILATVFGEEEKITGEGKIIEVDFSKLRK